MLAGIWHGLVHGTEESSLAMVRKYSWHFSESAGWSQLLNLFANPYFSRVWIVQEAVMFSSISVLASGEPISWDHLALFATKMGSYPYNEELRGAPGTEVKEQASSGLLQVVLTATIREKLRGGRSCNQFGSPNFS